MTGADRAWAARYNVGDVLQYTTGSKSEGIEHGSFAAVRDVDARKNALTVVLGDGESVSYDPHRLRGVNVFREVEREFAKGDGVQFAAPNLDLGIANRDLGTLPSPEDRKLTLRIDGKSARVIRFDSQEFRQFDHGYAVTSHSSQGLTESRVLVNIDTESASDFINDRLAYVAISCASYEARILTNKAATLGARLASNVSKTTAFNLNKPAEISAVPTQTPRAQTLEHEELGISI